MFLVVKATNAPSELKGLLRRFLVEPHSGLFIGKATRRVAEFIWEAVEQTDINDGLTALWILDNRKSEQGFEIREYGGETTLLDFDGFILPAKFSHKKP